MTVYLITKAGYGIAAEIAEDDLKTLRTQLLKGDVIDKIEGDE